jgi:hypothetical protein
MVLGAGRIIARTGLGRRVVSGVLGAARKIVPKAGAAVRSKGGQMVISGARKAGGVAAAGAVFEGGSRVVRRGETSAVPVPDGGYGGGYGGGGEEMSMGGMPVPFIVEPEYRESPRAPRGYVIVQDPTTGQPIAMLKEVAYALGLRKRSRRGGGISASDIRRAKKVQRVVTALTVKREPRVRLKTGKR